MGTTPDVVYSQQYIEAYELAYMQRESKLFAAVRHESMASKSKFVSYIGATTMSKKVTRHRNTPVEDAEHLRRRLQLTYASKALPLDDDDDLAMVGDVGGPYFQTLAAAAGVTQDGDILTAMGGIAYTGESGQTAVNNYDSGECRIINADGTIVTEGSDHSDTTQTNLTVSKIGLVASLMTDYHVPDDGNRHWVVNSANIQGLLKDTTYGSEEWLRVRDIKTNKVGEFMGFNWHVLATDMFEAPYTGEIATYAWHRNAVCAGVATGRNRPILKLQERPDKDNMMQYYGAIYTGATRLRGRGVVEVLLKSAYTL